MRFRTRAIHVGNSPDPCTGAVVPPIHTASTYVQEKAGEWGTFDYSRSGNPTRSAVQETLASLEGGCGSLAFSSGMAATHCATMLCNSGDQIIAATDIYGGTYRLLHKICNRSNIGVKLVDLQTPENLSSAIEPRTRIIWLEGIGNPRLTIPDLPAIVAIAKERGVLVAVDNTFATPVLMRPLEMGADIVMHSATKFLAGHSDCLAGVLVTSSADLLKQLYFIQNATGAVLSPFESFLLARGLKTLDLRVREQSRSALEVALFLAKHPLVSSVIYPGLPAHPNHARATNLLVGGYGAMITFEARGDFELTRRVVQSTNLFHLAVSLGAVESLIEQPASMSHASYDARDRQAAGIADSLIRLSVGLEDPHDLMDDLDQALRRAVA